IHAESGPEGRRLEASPLPRPGSEAKGSGFIVLLPPKDESWCAPLKAYLESPRVREWLDHAAERRSGRWVLDEPVGRHVPVPKLLVEQLQSQAEPKLPPDQGQWKAHAHEITQDPARVCSELEQLPAAAGADAKPWQNELRAYLWVLTVRALGGLTSGQSQL